MHKIYICTITEVHQDGEIYSTIIRDNDEDKVLERINLYFEAERHEGHECRFAPFTHLINGFDEYDNDNDRHYHICCDSIELDPRELVARENLSRREPGVPKEAVFAKTFLSELNHQPFSGKEFAKALCQEHPTTQQLFFKLIKDCILTRASERSYSTDERCESSVRFCRDLEELVKKYHFPMR